MYHTLIVMSRNCMNTGIVYREWMSHHRSIRADNYRWGQHPYWPRMIGSWMD